MFLALVKIYPRPGLERSILEVLDSLKGPTSIIGDCLGSSVSIEPEEGGAICYSEQWRSRESLDRHLRSPLYGRILAAMEFSRIPPEVKFYEATGVGGLDLVEKVRMPH